MKLKSIELVISAMSKTQYPHDGLPEVAFVGRSNVGKSSAINTLLNRRSLARVSQNPGKTRTINFYKINEEFYFVDLPGYGYAKTAKTERQHWGTVMQEYFENSQDLRHIFLLLDIRHEPKEDDILMYKYAVHYNIPVTIIATKSDKISRRDFQKTFSMMRKKLDYHGEKILPISSLKKTGKDEIWNHIVNIFEQDGYNITVE